MNKISVAFLSATLSISNYSVQASEILDSSLLPGNILSSLVREGVVADFNAINHTIINEKTAPDAPSPGDTFVTNGFGVFVPSFAGMELTYSYSISSMFTDYDQEQDKLFFNHRPVVDGVSNQLILYIDNMFDSETSNANEDDHNSYTDGLKIATMDLVFDNAGASAGYLQKSTGIGRDIVTFKLSESDMAQYGLSNNTVLLNKITSNITLADFVDGQLQGFYFGAFGSSCGSIGNLYNSCVREVGTSELILASVPVPASLGLFLSGFGLLGWLKKRK